MGQPRRTARSKPSRPSGAAYAPGAAAAILNPGAGKGISGGFSVRVKGQTSKGLLDRPEAFGQGLLRHMVEQNMLRGGVDVLATGQSRLLPLLPNAVGEALTKLITVTALAWFNVSDKH